MTGTTISHFRVLEKIGAGGMGEVYLADDLELKRKVALKFLPPHLSTDLEANQRFVQEAQSASGLNHPNVCTIHEIGHTEEGQTFIAMALYEGETLKAKLESGPVPIDEVADIARQVAEGLAAAHEQGIIHRDIKPANIFVTKRGRAVILDFGLAKLTGSLDLTKSGSTLGTAHYMSPEQIRNEEVDHRSDIWSLGVVLYEMLAGKRPFEGDYEQAISYAILNEEPDRMEAEALQDIVDGCLKKQREQRPQTASEMAAALRSIVGASAAGVITTPRPSTGGRRTQRHRRIAISVSLTLAIIITASLFLFRPEATSSAESLTTPLDAVVVLPFSVQGDESKDYLREGMVTMLSLMLDQTGKIRAIDPNAVLGFIDRNPRGYMDPEEGKSIASHFGATRFILGTVVKAGRESQVTVWMYDGAGTELMRTTEDLVSDEQLPVVLDRLGQALVFAMLDEPQQDFIALASGFTTSFEALRAFIAADQLLREGRITEAKSKSREIVIADSTFALGWYMVARAVGWSPLPEEIAESEAAALKALSLGASLSERTRMLLELGVQSKQKNHDATEQSLRDYLALYPDDARIWGVLGDLLFHRNHLRGRPMAEAIAPFRRSLLYEPDVSEMAGHLAFLALNQRDSVLADTAVSLIHEGTWPGTYYALLVQGITSGDRQRVDSVISTLRLTESSLLRTDLLASEQFELVDELVARADEIAANDSVAGVITYYVGGILGVTRGQFRKGDSLLALAYPFALGPATLRRVLGCVVPSSTIPESTMRVLLDEIAGWSDSKPRLDRWQNDVYPDYHLDVEDYLSGLLLWKLGESARVAARADHLERRAESQGELGMALGFSHSLRALIALQEHRLDDALGHLEKGHLDDWKATDGSAFRNQFLNRLVRGEIAKARGQYSQALAWYTSVTDGWTSAGVELSGQTYLRRAEIHQQLGEVEKAIRLYTRFIDLWSESDPELRPMVDEARARLERLLDAEVREPS